MITKVAIKGAEFYAFHGYYEEERLAGNTFVIDAEVSFKMADSGSDEIQNTVNYEQIYMICKDEMSTTQKLIETVVFNIVNRLKEDFPHIINATVKMEKMAPQLGGKVCKSVIEMEYKKQAKSR